MARRPGLIGYVCVCARARVLVGQEQEKIHKPVILLSPKVSLSAYDHLRRCAAAHTIFTTDQKLKHIQKPQMIYRQNNFV